jgi:carboxymethylenebutenolidase
MQEREKNADEALNGTNVNNQTPAVPKAGDIKFGFLTRKSRDGKDIRLYFAYPLTLNKEKPAPALLVIQEWWGINDDMQLRTQEFAKKGFYAVAPDLYYGKTTDDPAEAAKLKEAMTASAAMTAMKTGLDLVQEEVRNGVVDFKHVGVAGWCMGGEQALLLSCDDSRVKATAIFYGPLITDTARLKNIQGPVFGVFGNDDKAPSPDDVKKFKEAFHAASKNSLDVTQYDGVGHAFASKSAEKLGLYNAEKSEDAWNKLWTWLDSKLPRK